MKRIFLSLILLGSFAHAADPVDALGWLNRGNLLYSQKNFDGALAAYAKSLKIDNRSAMAYLGVGNCFAGKGDKVNALKHYKYSLQINPGNQALSAYVAKLEGRSVEEDDYARGARLYREKRYDEAIEANQKAAQAGVQGSRPWQAMGNCYYAKGDKANAIKSYRKALDLDPSNAALANFLAGYAGTQTAQASGPSASSGGWFQPAWRSAIVPGWGQFYNGEGGKGLVLGALTYGLLAGEIGTYTAGMSARSQYLSANSPGADYDTPYSTWESMATMNHYFSIGMTLAYSYTLIDAIWNAGHSSPMGALPRELPVQVASDGQGLSLRANVIEF